MNKKFDPVLLGSFLLLLGVSVVMVTSASIPVTEKYQVSDFYFFFQHLIHVIIGILCCLLIYVLNVNQSQSPSEAVTNLCKCRFSVTMHL